MHDRDRLRKEANRLRAAAKEAEERRKSEHANSPSRVKARF
jgi:hypothetical protein